MSRESESRERHQLVIALGEGAQGRAIRQLFDEHAEKAGLPVTTWARRLLQRHCGEAVQEVVARSEMEALAARVQALEDALAGRRRR